MQVMFVSIVRRHAPWFAYKGVLFYLSKLGLK